MHPRYSQPGFSRLVQRMEADGLVERRPDPDDGRARRSSSPPASARSRYAAANAVYTAELRRSFGRHLRADQHAALAALLDSVASVPRELRPMTTAFVCAMPMEIVPLVKKLSLDKDTIGGVPVRTGSVVGKPVVAIVTGMGTEFARTKTSELLDAVPVERVVVVGITGALENDTPIGTLVMPEVVVNSATGDEHTHTPLDGAATHGKMWTTDGLTTSPDELARLRADGVVSLDMETAAIAEVCEARGIPWSVYRVISDRASDGSIDEEVFHLSNQDGTPKPRAVLVYFAKHPAKIPQMMRLAKGARLATQRAADAAIAAVTNA